MSVSNAQLNLYICLGVCMTKLNVKYFVTLLRSQRKLMELAESKLVILVIFSKLLTF